MKEYCQQVSFQPLYRYTAIFAGRQFRRHVSPFPAIRSNSDCTPKIPHSIVPLVSFNAILRQPRAKINASLLQCVIPHSSRANPSQHPAITGDPVTLSARITGNAARWHETILSMTLHTGRP